jgi:DNA-binding transcriptional ArsR family regulator
MEWAWRQEVPSGQKLVLLALADRANEDDGTCWPGLRRVAEKVGLEQRTVRRHVEALEAAGMLRRESRVRADGSHTSNLIVLAMHGSSGGRSWRTGGGGHARPGGLNPKLNRHLLLRRRTRASILSSVSGWATTIA